MNPASRPLPAETPKARLVTEFEDLDMRRRKHLLVGPMEVRSIQVTTVECDPLREYLLGVFPADR